MLQIMTILNWRGIYVSGLFVALMVSSGLAHTQARKCDLDFDESALASMLVNHPDQARAEMHCDEHLVAFARQRALDLHDRAYFSHVSPERIGPNAMLAQSGYPLPSLYPGLTANTVEALAKGFETAQEVFGALMASRVHRTHLLAKEPIFEEQDEFGIARLESAESETLWVVVIARKQRPDEPHYLCTPPPATCFPVQ